MIERVIQLFFFAGALFLAIPPIRSDMHAAPTVLPQMIWAGILFAAFLGIDLKFGRPLWQCIAILLIFEGFVFALVQARAMF